MRTLAFLCRQLEHFWAQSGDHGRRFFRRGESGVRCAGHLVEIAAHGRQWRSVVKPSYTFNQRFVGHTHTQQETTTGLFRQGLLSREGDAGFTVVDIDDAALINLATRARLGGGNIALVSPSAFVHGVMQATRLDTWFDICESVELARKTLESA